MRYQNVIFDLYGTLLDIHTNEQKSYLWQKMSELFRAYGAYYTPSALKEAYHEYVHLFESQLSGPYPEIQLDLVFYQLFQDRGILADQTLINHTGITFRTISRSRLALYPDTIEMLSLLKKQGRNLYLLSNAQHMFTEPEITMTGLSAYLDGILYSSDAGCKKPDPSFMELLLDSRELKKETCIMVGNEAASDIAVANAVGMDSIYLHTNLSPAGETAPTATYQILDGDHLQIPAILSAAK